MTTTVAYGMADLAGSPDGRVGPGAVTVSGGCGQSHRIQVDDSSHPYIECDVCAPLQISRHYGWSASPAGVPATPDQRAERELAEREGTAATNIMLRQVSEALAGAAVKKLQGQPETAAVPLLDQLKALTPDERDALLGQLGVPAAEVPAPAGGKAGAARKTTAGRSSGVQG